MIPEWVGLVMNWVGILSRQLRSFGWLRTLIDMYYFGQSLEQEISHTGLLYKDVHDTYGNETQLVTSIFVNFLRWHHHPFLSTSRSCNLWRGWINIHSSHFIRCHALQCVLQRPSAVNLSVYLAATVCWSLYHNKAPKTFKSLRFSQAFAASKRCVCVFSF